MAEIAVLQANELTLSLARRFSFDWKKEVQYDIYKLFLKESGLILGLMSLEVVRPEWRIEIRLLESARENIGKHKMYDRVAGCLIAYACKESFKWGFGGFVSLVPKTELISYYQQAYQFFPMGRHLAIEGGGAHWLIEKYLQNSNR
ncbi:MAG: hypothetical protein QM664_07815 [Flavihumibacter sp.]